MSQADPRCGRQDRSLLQAGTERLRGLPRADEPDQDQAVGFLTSDSKALNTL